MKRGSNSNSAGGGGVGRLGGYGSRRNSILRSGTVTPRLPPGEVAGSYGSGVGGFGGEDAENRLRWTLEKIVTPSVNPTRAPSATPGGAGVGAGGGGGGPSGSIGVEGESVMESVSPWPGEVGMVEIKRPVYSQYKFENLFHQEDEEEPLRKRFIDSVFVPSGPRRSCADLCGKLLPCIKLLREYRPREHLPLDLVSGLSTGIMRIPQSMAYALLAYLSPVYGLYTAFVSGVVYCLLGTSPHLVMSCQGVVSLMVGQVVKRFADRAYPMVPGGNSSGGGGNGTAPTDGTQPAELMLEIVLVVSLLVGILQLLFGLLRLGMLTNYLSDPLIGGFTTGAAIEVISSQLSAIVGYNIIVPKGTPPEGVFEIFKEVYFALSNLTRFNPATIIISILSVGFLVMTKLGNSKLQKYCKLPIPGELILVVVVTLASYLGRFYQFGVDQVGPVPQGFKAPRVPQLQIADAALIQECVIIAIVAFSVSVSVAKKFALQYDTEIDANQEFLAYGAGNLAGAFSNCFVSTSSMSCSALHESLGGRTQVANLFASTLVLITILFLGPTFETTPKCVLSAIILVNLKSMLWQFGDLPQLWNVSKIDFLLWVVTCVSVICFNVDTGLIIGVAFSLLTIVFRSQWPYACVLGRIPHTDIYKNIVVTPDAKEIEGIKIFRYEGSLYFASADHFLNSLYLLTGCNPRQLAIKQQVYDRSLRNLRLTVKEAIPVLQQPAGAAAAAAASNWEVEAQESRVTNYGSVPTALTVSDLRPATSLHHVIIDFSCCSFVDSVGLRMLNHVLEDYREAGVTVFLSNTRAAVRFMLSKPKVSKVDMKKIFLSNHDAVSAALSEAHKIEEKNWLDFDSIARQRMNLVKQHYVSRLPSEIDEDEDMDDEELDTESVVTSVSASRSRSRAVSQNFERAPLIPK